MGHLLEMFGPHHTARQSAVPRRRDQESGERRGKRVQLGLADLLKDRVGARLRSA
jgi:hypothetical protein